MIIPTLVDPSMALPGKHIISRFVQYALYKLAPDLGTWDDQREAFGDAVVDRIAEFAPTSATSSCTATCRPCWTSSARPG